MALGILLMSACDLGAPDTESLTDDPGVRTAAAAVARSYVESHRSELSLRADTTLDDARIAGGHIRDLADDAFEIRFSVEAPGVSEIVVYVTADERSLHAEGAQARDDYGAVVHDLGDRLDRRFRSRD